MYPNDAITLRSANNTGTDNVSHTFLNTSTNTILGIVLNSKDIRDSVVYCGSDIIFQQRASIFSQHNTNFLCENKAITAKIDRTTTLLITYVPYNLRLVPTSTGNFTLDNGATFTSGDLFISLLLFIGLIIAIIILAIKSIFGVSVHKKYTGVNTFEGKEHYKI